MNKADAWPGARRTRLLPTLFRALAAGRPFAVARALSLATLLLSAPLGVSALLKVSRTAAAQNQISAYVIRYKLDLWSTFTYYLKDPTLGDQMLQHDDRVVYGAKVSETWYGFLARAPMSNVIGIQTRFDDIRDVGIFPTFRRQVLGTGQNAGVKEGSVAIYAENTIRWRDWLRSTVGLREDELDFRVVDKMRDPEGSCDIRGDPLGCDTGSKRAALLSPKVGLVFGPWAKTTGFIDFGDGFHSNDARGVTRSAENPEVAPVTPLTRATGAEIGIATQAIPNLDLRLDLFRLKLRSELVFDGAGTTSPSGATTRTGIELASRYRFNSWLSAELNSALTRARFDHDTEADDLGCGDAAPSHPCAQPIAIVGRYIPNSPTNVIDARLTMDRESGWFGSLRARHFGKSPLVEDGSANSPAYTTLDAEIGFRSSQHWQVALEVFNIADVKWNDIEYYYVSRLACRGQSALESSMNFSMPVKIDRRYALLSPEIRMVCRRRRKSHETEAGMRRAHNGCNDLSL